MKRAAYIILCVCLISSCYKDEIVIEDLNYNPFDRDYAGPPVFELIGTYQETVTIQGNPVLRQVIEFRVLEERFIEPASYSVRLREQGETENQILYPTPLGSNTFRYTRAPQPGVPVCLVLSLANNFTFAREEVLCATL